MIADGQHRQLVPIADIWRISLDQRGRAPRNYQAWMTARTENGRPFSLAGGTGLRAPKLPHDANERGVHKGTQTGHSTFRLRRLTASPGDRRKRVSARLPR